MTSHNFSSIQGDSGMISISFSCTRSVTEVAASTLPGTDSTSRAPRGLLRQQRARTHVLSERGMELKRKTYRQKYSTRGPRRTARQISPTLETQQRQLVVIFTTNNLQFPHIRVWLRTLFANFPDNPMTNDYFFFKQKSRHRPTAPRNTFACCFSVTNRGPNKTASK